MKSKTAPKNEKPTFGNLGVLKERVANIQTKKDPGAESDKILWVEADECYSEKQVRKKFNEESIDELGKSMEDHGQDHPVRVHPKDSKGYRIIKGERRWRAAKKRKLKLAIWVDQSSPSEAGILIGQIVENDQREDIAPLERAEGYRAIKELTEKETGKSIQLGELSEILSRSKSVVSKYLALLTMPEEIQELAETRIVSDVETLRALHKIHELDPDRCAKLCASIIEDGGITRKYAEAYLKSLKQEIADKNKPSNQSSQPALGNREQEAEREHQQDLKGSGLDEEGLHAQNDGQESLETGDPLEGEGAMPEPPKDVPMPAAKLSDSGSSIKDDKTGFNRRPLDQVVYLVSFVLENRQMFGSIKLGLHTDNQDEVVVRVGEESGKERLIAIMAEELTVIGIR
ncbi:ParB/RepB/Spo0J family partition protein [Hydrocarboniclastica marina]|uniref:ParB/RepB/Spo0J family partition protein n=1 Tax=Hydrocarboniclastica marina TaxID=2259620 RepID=A0A4P7XN29_9ALTE|nr:ParB/RepB/Spo0J family partition protein [Hydrocarboniclastica marina]QCF28122.1 ParB/RepB/Spo0J family partition protein [Hydrocarboniclastica marina]